MSYLYVRVHTLFEGIEQARGLIDDVTLGRTDLSIADYEYTWSLGEHRVINGLTLLLVVPSVEMLEAVLRPLAPHYDGDAIQHVELLGATLSVMGMNSSVGFTGDFLRYYKG